MLEYCYAANLMGLYYLFCAPQSAVLRKVSNRGQAERNRQQLLRLAARAWPAGSQPASWLATATPAGDRHAANYCCLRQSSASRPHCLPVTLCPAVFICRDDGAADVEHCGHAELPGVPRRRQNDDAAGPLFPRPRRLVGGLGSGQGIGLLLELRSVEDVLLYACCSSCRCSSSSLRSSFSPSV